ncbi:MAG: DNA recombination protein RmuC, partial [Eudoraea sp.]|nr:DNA recombination protein RmuC [Eudoraea sp.]
MNSYFVTLITGILLGVAGFFLGNYIQRLKTRSRQGALEEREQQLLKNLKDLEGRLLHESEQKATLQDQKEALGNLNTRYQADLENLHIKNSEQKQEVTKLQEKFTKEFENLANKILEEKSLKFTEQNQKNIKNILSPLQDKIQL